MRGKAVEHQPAAPGAERQRRLRERVRPLQPRGVDAIAEALLLPSGIDGIYARTAVYEDVVNGLASAIGGAIIGAIGSCSLFS